MPDSSGRYHLLKRIAVGGMAEIWLAKQRGPEGFERLVVIKRVLPHLAESKEFVDLFLDEARLAASLSHPGIGQILELGHAGNDFFIAMEYIHGEDLQQVFKQAWRHGDGIPVSIAVKLVSQASEALHYAHTKTDLEGKPLEIVHGT